MDDNSAKEPHGPGAADSAEPAPGAREPQSPSEAAHRAPTLAVYWARGLLALASAGYAVFAASQISRAYVDFGDGNYLYIASRIADGLVPYRDIMAPQPPLHLLIGSWLLSVGEWLGIELHVVRWCSILLRIATAFLVGSMARRACRSACGGMLAGAVYLFLPNGLTWSLGYQSEALEILFLALMALLMLPMNAAGLVGASVFATLAVFTNMTAVPYVGLAAVWLIWRRRWLSLAFIVPLVVLVNLGILGMEWWTGRYLDNVLFNQVGTFPKEGLVSYVRHKIFRASLDIAFLEGLAVAMAAVGIALYWLRDSAPEREFLALFGLASLGSIVFVSKGGTEQYIFTLGEPYVAVFFAYAVAWIARAGLGKWARQGMANRALGVLLKAAIVGAVLAAFGFQTYRRLLPVAHGETVQLSSQRVKQIHALIGDFSNARDPILSPPYFAFETRRLVAGEYSEIFIWTIGYWVEQDFRRDRKPMAAHGPFTRKVLELADMLEKQKIPLVILDLEQTGQIPVIQEALYRRYRPLVRETYHTRDTPLAFYVPRRDGESLNPLAKTLDELYPLPSPAQAEGPPAEPST